MKQTTQMFSNSFAPNPTAVVVSKGKKYFKHEGNQMLRRIAASRIGEYAQARTKLDKSLIISEVVDRVRSLGGFVKLEQVSGCWIQAEDLLCREKTSGVFREALNEYRTSNQSQLKTGKRQREENLTPIKLHEKLDFSCSSVPTSLFLGLELLQSSKVGSQMPFVGATGDEEESLSGLSLSLSLLPENERSSLEFFDMTDFVME